MYVKTKRPVYRTDQYHKIKLRALETTQVTDLDSTARYTVEYIGVADTETEEELTSEILHGLKTYVYDGVDVRELCRIQKKHYGVAAAYCCDLVARLKIEMGIYCPDHRHLYYVYLSPPQ